MKLTMKLLTLFVLVCGFAVIGCGPAADPQNASGEAATIDEEAYAKEMAESEAQAKKEIGQE